MPLPTPHLTESTAALLLLRRSFLTGTPGFVGARIGLREAGGLPDGRHRLRHGHLDVRGGHATLSVPPSPGLDIAVERARDDLHQVQRWSGSGTRGTSKVQITLDAGTAARGPLGYRHRWALAHAVGPVLHAVFGAPTTTVPPPPGTDPRAAWCTAVLDTVRADGRTFRDWTRADDRPTHTDLDTHLETLPMPVRARGHLEIDVAGPLPRDQWIAALAVTAALFADARAATEARTATALLARPDMDSPWTRAAAYGLGDPDLAAAARTCLFASYDGLARQGASRAVREIVAAVIENTRRPSRAVPR